MSTATAVADEPAAPKKGKKKLIIIVGAAVLLLAVAGGGALLYLKKSRAAAEEAADGAPAATVQHEQVAAPTFVPLDPFTVNLADREAERYAQIGITFAVEDSKVVDSMKLFMPAVRNNILMVLAHKTSAELLQRDGKERLANEIRREASRALGYTVPDVEPTDTVDDGEKKPKRKPQQTALPIKAVLFSNFIVQ